MSSCRICFGEESESKESLIESPCACSGTMSHVHVSCLNSGICGVCHERFWYKLPFKVRAKRVGFFLYRYMVVMSKAVIPAACMSYMYDREHYVQTFAYILGTYSYGFSILEMPWIAYLSVVIPYHLWIVGLIITLFGSLVMVYSAIRYGECKL
jgi:hypothetical protein